MNKLIRNSDIVKPHDFHLYFHADTRRLAKSWLQIYTIQGDMK